MTASASGPSAVVPTSPRERNLLVGAGVVASLATGWTRPFTVPADVAVATALLVATCVIVCQQRVGRRLPALARRPNILSRSESDRWLRFWPWITTVGAATGFELLSVSSLPRAAHPTLSSMLDAVDRTYGGHVIAFGCWLLLGWYLVTR